MADAAPVIFISYRRLDSGDSARRLHDALALSFGPQLIFIDVEDIPGGAVFPIELSRAIAGASAVIAVIGPGWVSASNERGRRLDDPDDHVRRELELALSLDKLVIPVRVDGAEMPRAADLPGTLAAFADRHALVVDWQRPEDGLGRLLDALARAAVIPVPPVAFPEDQARRIERREGWRVAGDANAVRVAVEELARARPHSRHEWDGDVLVVRSGKKAETRLLGVYLVSDSKLPMQARIRVTAEGGIASIEAHLWEDWGPGFTWGLERRYVGLFKRWLADLRDVTGAER